MSSAFTRSFVENFPAAYAIAARNRQEREANDIRRAIYMQQIAEKQRVEADKQKKLDLHAQAEDDFFTYMVQSGQMTPEQGNAARLQRRAGGPLPAHDYGEKQKFAVGQESRRVEQNQRLNRQNQIADAAAGMKVFEDEAKDAKEKVKRIQTALDKLSKNPGGATIDFASLDDPNYDIGKRVPAGQKAAIKEHLGLLSKATEQRDAREKELADARRMDGLAKYRNAGGPLGRAADAEDALRPGRQPQAPMPAPAQSPPAQQRQQVPQAPQAPSVEDYNRQSSSYQPDAARPQAAPTAGPPPPAQSADSFVKPGYVRKGSSNKVMSPDQMKSVFQHVGGDPQKALDWALQNGFGIFPE